MRPMTKQFQRRETSTGDMNTPVTFYKKTDDDWMPGETTKEKLYFCMAEMYQASIKDYEIVNTTNAEYVITILIPAPRESYLPKYDHHFEVDELMYKDVVFNLQSIAPKDDLLKIVGVAYGS